jgi:hypothetical protein
MATKYLKSFKVKTNRYWWLVEAHREGGKVVQKKLKYWGKTHQEKITANILCHLMTTAH